MKLARLQKIKNDTPRDVRILVHHNIHRQRSKSYFYIKTMPSLKRKGNNTDDVHVSAKRARRPIIHDLAHQIKSAQKKTAVFNGAETIIIKATLVYPWLTRDMVYGYLRRMKAKEAKYIKMAIEKNTNTNSNSLAICNKHGGRLEGSSTKQIENTKTQKDKAIDDISIYMLQKKS